MKTEQVKETKNLVDRIDSSIGNTYKTMENMYVAKTGKDVSNLPQKMNRNSAIAFGLSALLTPYNYVMDLGFAIYQGISFKREGNTPAFYDSTSGKLANIAMAGVGVIFSTIGAARTVGGIISGNGDEFREGLGNLSSGVGFTFMAGSNYLNKAETPTKTTKK